LKACGWGCIIPGGVLTLNARTPNYLSNDHYGNN
jgi:hypothetical protein